MNRRHFLWGSLAGAGIPAPVTKACIWDRDTLAQEAAQSPGYVAVITGRFPRYPARYYEMRLERVTRELEAAPDRLDLYDDAGVSCDRLGRGEAAIAWMAEKRERLESFAPGRDTGEHRYRYFANLGTFEIHDWVRRGSTSVAFLDQAESARSLIAEAIRLNPNAHFGREKYQFMAIDWIIRSVKEETDSHFFLEESDHYRATLGNLPLKQADPAQGIAGLVYLGNAWESADVFRNLGLAFARTKQASIAQLAYLRAGEILASGGKSFSRGGEFDPSLNVEDSASIRNARWFIDARREADRWLKDRNSYLERQFAEGRHPDTHPDFWKGHVDRSEPPEFLHKKVR